MKRSPMPRRTAPLRRTGFGSRGDGLSRQNGISKRRKPKGPWKEGRDKCRSEGCCRICGRWDLADPHHIVYRSLGGDDDRRNCLPTCRACHDAIHDRKVDVWEYLSTQERKHAIEQMGAERALELLNPSTSIRRAA